MSFNISPGEAVIWAVIGLLAGSFAGLIVTRTKEGFGPFLNLVFGLLGAFVGGALFDLLKIDFRLGTLTLDLNKLAAACVGAVIVVLGATLLHKQRSKK
ncbi:MAG: GlsB/YeaQ/YmgE family stress response membrane protein [Planctomycetota bacterium]